MGKFGRALRDALTVAAFALFAIWATTVALPTLSIWQGLLVALAVAVGMLALLVLLGGRDE